MEYAQPAIIIAVITAIVQAVKQIPVLADNKKWCPTISAIVGIIAGVIAALALTDNPNVAMGIFQGI